MNSPIETVEREGMEMVESQSGFGKCINDPLNTDAREMESDLNPFSCDLIKVQTFHVKTKSLQANHVKELPNQEIKISSFNVK